MKKVLLALFLVLTIFTLTACGTDDNDDDMRSTKMSNITDTIEEF